MRYESLSRVWSWFAGREVLLEITMMFLYVKIVVSCVLEFNSNNPRTHANLVLTTICDSGARGNMVNID